MLLGKTSHEKLFCSAAVMVMYAGMVQSRMCQLVWAHQNTWTGSRFSLKLVETLFNWRSYSCYFFHSSQQFLSIHRAAKVNTCTHLFTHYSLFREQPSVTHPWSKTAVSHPSEKQTSSYSSGAPVLHQAAINN